MRNSKILLGICSVGLFLVLFGMILTKPDLVTAQISNESNSFTYTGINNNSETLYSINFADENTMEVTDENKFLMPSIPVVVNKERVVNVNILSNSTNSNILGGDNIKLEDNSNITIIGGIGNGDSIIGANNHNATFFGGKWNKIDNNDSLGVPSVLIGGESNVMNENHEANVIVGGSNNFIYEDSNNVNILGGSDVQVGGENIIAGGSNMNFNSKDDIFIFSDGGGDGSEEGTFTPQTSGAFFLNVSNGVGFGTGSDGNLGAISNGAVSLGNININSIDCTVDADTIGVQGVWNGCLVGCTSGSASDSKWELLDHGNLCEEICKTNEKCSQIAVQNNVEEYTSFCTQGLVYTGNSYLCSNRGLNAYKNVVFETYLIDSEEECPSNAHNQCAYRCNSNAHLTGDVTGKKDGVTMCFKDCKLPWDSTISKKHNETITGYNVQNAYCTSTQGDTCAAHKAELICVDGDWYTTNSDGKAESLNIGYIYGVCNLQSQGCDESFNLTRQDIIENKWDFVRDWHTRFGWGTLDNRPELRDFILHGKLPNHPLSYDSYSRSSRDREDSGIKEGIRGRYELCLGYVPLQNPSNEAPGNESCVDPTPGTYRYRFKECQPGFVLDNGICRKNCSFRDGSTINHLSGITIYNLGSYSVSAVCPNNCAAEEFTCYDGRFYKSSSLHVSETKIEGDERNQWGGSTSCTLVGQLCNGYSIPTSIRNEHSSTSIYSSCQKYTVNSTNSQCITGDMVYALTGCRSGNHTENVSPINNQYCVSNTRTLNCSGTPPTNASWSGNGQITATWSGTWNNGSWQTPSCDWQCNAGYYKDGGSCNTCPTGYTSNTGATAQNQCYITCTAGNHLAEANDSSCTACPTGKTKSQHTVYYGDTSSCSNCTSWKPDHSSYYNGCIRKCDAGYYEEVYYTNNQGSRRCTLCPDGSTSNTGAESLSECYALPQCGTKADNPPTHTQYYTEDDDTTYCTVGQPVTIPGFGVNLTEIWTTATFNEPARLLGYEWTCRDNNGHDEICFGRLPNSCTGPCGTVGHGETLSCYASDSAYCPNTCQKESLLCRDGQFGRIVYNLGGGGRGFSTGYFSHTDYTYSSCTLRGTSNNGWYNQETAFSMRRHYSGYLFDSITGYKVVNNQCEEETLYKWNGHCMNEEYVWASSEIPDGYVATGTKYLGNTVINSEITPRWEFVSHKINGQCVPTRGDRYNGSTSQYFKWDYPKCANGYTFIGRTDECVRTPRCDFSKNYAACEVGYVHHNPGQGSSLYNQYWNCINPNWHNAATASANVAMTPCTRI